ncbi:MAG: hypothetical protein CTY16_02010 [Methylobacter sp.]|nr:MAG: hypothetical protein CTY16_02010 [Methylobacter sp.]
MKNHRLFIRVLIAVSWVSLTGFKQPSHHNVPTATAKSDTSKAPEEPPPKPPLDLTIPFKNPENTKPSFLETNHNQQKAFDGLFAAKPKTRERPFQLNGSLISSPEPEAEKRKSVDGAGIVINIKE